MIKGRLNPSIYWRERVGISRGLFFPSEVSCPPPPPPPPYYSLYIKSPPPQEVADRSVLAERGETTCFWMIKVDCISAGLRFASPGSTAHAQSDIAFACLRRGFQHRRTLVSP